MPTHEEILAGQAVYNPRVLFWYDKLLNVSNALIWRCTTQQVLNHYRHHISDNHLDVGVGTGYYLDKCGFKHPQPRIVLMDLNQCCLDKASQRLARYRPETVIHNLFDDQWPTLNGFDSISFTYVLHCLPGTMEEKAKVLDRLKSLLNPGGRLIGATILNQSDKANFLSRRFMRFYNRKKVFCNYKDDPNEVEKTLKNVFDTVKFEQHGHVALFVGYRAQ